MLVYIVGFAQTMLYLLSIPVHVALRVDGLEVGAGVTIFNGAAAWRKAERGAGGKGKGAKPRFSRIWPILRRTRFERVALTGRVALGDAAATALLCGGLNALAWSLRGRTAKLTANVRPEYADRVNIALRGMICARSGQIIRAVIQYRKEGFFDGQASD